MTDWRTCTVVRDRDGGLWARSHGRMWVQIAGDWRIGDIGLASHHGPLTPVLDADGQPVVHTVGDLTAQHVGRVVSIDGHEGVLSELLALFDMVQLAVNGGEGHALFPDATLDTPCEVLP